MQLPILTKAILFLLSLSSWYLSEKNIANTKLKRELYALKDDSWEQTLLLEEKNKTLLTNQDAQLELKIANERNRIARDIHDNVGHLLSSAIIQLGAIKIINQSTPINKMLDQVDLNLNSSMTSVRNSVHNLHDTSLSLEEAIHQLTHQFLFCDITIIGEVPESLTEEQTTLLKRIIKEGLTNVIKHSNATLVSIIFDSLPAFYRIKLIDNGSLSSNQSAFSTGIGLSSMKQRIEEIRGQLHIKQADSGFQLYIILPKEIVDDTSGFSRR